MSRIIKLFVGVVMLAAIAFGGYSWLQGRELEMGFATIILAVLVGGAVAGILGMLLAVPAAACLRIAWFEVVEPRLAKFADS